MGGGGFHVWRLRARAGECRHRDLLEQQAGDQDHHETDTAAAAAEHEAMLLPAGDAANPA